MSGSRGLPWAFQVVVWALLLAIIGAAVLESVRGRAVFAVVDGRSMEPALHTGDLVFLAHRSPESVKVGDVVVYKRGSRYIIHRVVYTYEKGDTHCYVVWGDNRETNRFPDFGDPGVCGTIRFRDPYTGKAVTASGIPYAWIVGVVVEIDGYIVKVPYLGAISLAFKGAG